tara:strand:- start:3211 stop:3660 length:450 start_codon:yes stop_codon:yes gene_type:complete
MNKSNKNKTNPLDNIIKNVEKYNDLYDNVIVDGNELKLESQKRKEIERRNVPSWQLMKEVAQDKARKGNTKELNDLLNIERKMRKKTYTAKRTAPKQVDPNPTVPLDLIDFNDFKIESKPNTTLKQLEAERTQTDPDVYKGLGIFFPKK